MYYIAIKLCKCSPYLISLVVALTFRDCMGVSRDIFVYMGKLAFFFKNLKPSGMLCVDFFANI